MRRVENLLDGMLAVALVTTLVRSPGPVLDVIRGYDLFMAQRMRVAEGYPDRAWIMAYNQWVQCWNEVNR